MTESVKKIKEYWKIWAFLTLFAITGWMAREGYADIRTDIQNNGNAIAAIGVKVTDIDKALELSTTVDRINIKTCLGKIDKLEQRVRELERR